MWLSRQANSHIHGPPGSQARYENEAERGRSSLNSEALKNAFDFLHFGEPNTVPP